MFRPPYPRDDNDPSQSPAPSQVETLAGFALHAPHEEAHGARISRASLAGQEGIAVQLPLPPEARPALLDVLARLRRVEDPALGPLLAFGEEPTGVYWIAAPPQGIPLAEKLARWGPFQRTPALSLLAQLAGALAALGAAGLHLGELRPIDIFFTEPTEARLFLLVGPEWVLQQARPDDLALTGNPFYLCPEGLRTRRFDARSAVYCLACLFVELVGGSPLRVTGRLDQFFQPAPPLPLLDAEPAAVQQLLRRALSPDPSERPPDPISLVEALRAAYHEPVAPAPLPSMFLARMEELSPVAQRRVLQLARAPHDPLRLVSSVRGPVGALFGGAAAISGLLVAAVGAPAVLPALAAKLLLSGSSGVMLWGGLRVWQRRGPPLGEFWYVHPSFLIRAEQWTLAFYPMACISEVRALRDAITLRAGEQELVLPWGPPEGPLVVEAIAAFSEEARRAHAAGRLHTLPEFSLFAPEEFLSHAPSP